MRFQHRGRSARSRNGTVPAQNSHRDPCNRIESPEPNSNIHGQHICDQGAKRLSFVHCVLLAPWSQMCCPCMFELGSGLSILLHGSVCLFLGPDCAVSVPSASSSMLKSESVIRPALFIFLRIPWTIQGLLLLARNFRILSSISLANMAASLTVIAWNPEIPFSALDVTSELILPILGPGISFFFLVSS